MTQQLPNGVKLPAIGDTDWGNDMNDNLTLLDNTIGGLDSYAKKADTYTKKEVDSKLVSVYKYVGTVNSVSDLPATSTIGYVYNVLDTGMNYAWDGTEWDALGSEIDLTDYVKNTDFATSTKGGVFKFSQSHGITMSSDGFLMGATRTAEQYNSNSGNMLINKGTLENVLTSKGFATNSDVVHKTGNETIDGLKTFLGSPTVTRMNVGTTGYVVKLSFKRGEEISATNHSTFRVTDSENNIVSEVCTENYADGKVAQILNIRNTNDAGAQVQSSVSHLLDKTGDQDWLYSTRDGKTYLGTSSYRWADVNTVLINGEPVVTPNYLETKAEEWEFTLSDGSTVTKKIVCM